MQKIKLVSFEKLPIDFLLLTLIIIFSLLIRIIQLQIFPSTITGDEITYLSEVEKIIFTHKLYFFSLMGDGTVAGINFYLPAFLTYLLGTDNSLLALRLSSAIVSCLALIPFYFILKTETNRYISFIITLLLASNYVYLNFSRTGWINNTTMVFTSLCIIFLLKKLTVRNSILYYFLLGVACAFTFYGYLFGKLFVLLVSLYLPLVLIVKKCFQKNIHNLLIYVLTLLILTTPFVINIFTNQAQFYARPLATYAYSPSKINSNGYAAITLYQLQNSFLGLVLLDPSVMGRGIENLRYTPLYHPPIALPLKLLFICSLIYVFFFYNKRSIWLMVFISIFMINFLTQYPPNYARGLLYIPFIYITLGIFLYFVYNKFFLHLNKNKKIIICTILFFLSFVLVLNDLNFYNNWMRQKEEIDARQPALSISDYKNFQQLQIKRIKNEQTPLTVYGWNLLKTNR